jgi:hypothetical protein
MSHVNAQPGSLHQVDRLVLDELLNLCVVDTELPTFTYCQAICMYLPLHLVTLALCYLSFISASRSDSPKVIKLSVATWESTIGTELERNNSLLNFISSNVSAYVYCMYIGRHITIPRSLICDTSLYAVQSTLQTGQSAVRGNSCIAGTQCPAD